MIDDLKTLLATTFCLMHKTQDAHWNVTGHAFKALHELFAEQYEDLATMVDDVAELIRANDEIAPAGLAQYLTLSKTTDSLKSHNTDAMLTELHADHKTLMALMDNMKNSATTDVTNFLEDRIQAHAKHAWMLLASTSSSIS